MVVIACFKVAGGEPLEILLCLSKLLIDFCLGVSNRVLNFDLGIYLGEATCSRNRLALFT